MPDERHESGAVSARERDQLRLSRSELLIIVAFWTFMAMLTAANRMLNPRGPGLQPDATLTMVALTFVESYVWALLTPPLFALSGRIGLDRHARLGRVLFLLGVGIVVAIVVGASMESLRGAVFDFPRRPEQRGIISRSFGGFWLLNDFVIYMAIVAAGVARANAIRFRARRQEAIELHAQLADARLDTLRMQLDPHFLFNTLNAISSLVERDPRGVRRMISRLSDLLRHTIEGPAAQEIPLRAELDLLRRYLEIMEVRFQGRLTVRIEAGEDVLDALVPNLILQPIVENAIKHGVSEIEGDGRIDVSAEHAGGELVLRVWNNAPATVALPPASARPDGRGVGLRNTLARLEQLYGGGQRFALRVHDGGVLAELRVPFHTSDDVRAVVVPES